MNRRLWSLFLLFAVGAAVTAAATMAWSTATPARAATMLSPLGDLQKCSRGTGLPDGFGSDPHSGMVRVPAGRFAPGTLQGYADERPAGDVSVAAFWMDRTEVSNAQFDAFARATGYRTNAERQGGAVVFQAPARGQPVAQNAWWKYTTGANWRHPEGPASELEGRWNQPVVHITLADAQAYARWLGHELPTEAQWEWAARGGGSPELVDREPRSADGRATANYWQGVFPDLNTHEDGFIDRAPVGCFAANGYGLHDMIGNVWEWTRDVYQGQRQAHGSGEPEKVALQRNTSALPMVIKGGSFLCAADYCVRYRAAARHPQESDLGVAHVGFRTVASAN